MTKERRSCITPSDHVQELPRSFTALRRTFMLGYRAEPRLLVLSLSLALLMMLPDALIALWLKFLTEAVLHADRGQVIAAALGLAVSSTATWFLSVASQRVQRRFRDRIAIVLESHVARLQASVPTIEHHERPEYLDRLSMLRDQVFVLDHLFMSLFSTLGWIVRVLVTVGLLASIHPGLIALALFTIPALYTSTSRPTAERQVRERVASHQRLSAHLFNLATTASPAKEIRVTNSEGWLARMRRAEWERWFGEIARSRWATALWQASGWAVFSAAYVGAIVWVVAGMGRGAGDVVLVVVAGHRLARFVNATAGELGFLRGFWLDGSRRLAWLEDFARRAEAGANRPAPERLEQGITFEEISFRYPGSERMALERVHVHLPAGQVVAIVGENGAGKTTLVKLLARMYAPTSGRILVDGIDLATITTDTWRAKLAGAFQDFFRYEFRAQHTVGIGDLPALDDRPAVEAAVDRAGASEVIRGLAAGLDTQLGPAWDEGVDVSHGQWQKLALARGFMRDEPLVLILDEPTSALDAETEHALFARYADVANQAATNGRITVLVSHRFSTVRMAHLIVVMDGAKVAEFGSHDELMARGGQYFQLYSLQAAAFR